MVSYRGWNVTLSYNVYSTEIVIGKAASVDFEIESGLEPYYEAGNRQARYLVEGNEKVTGTFRRLWLDIAFLNLIKPGSKGAIGSFNFKCQLNQGGPYVQVNDCKMDSDRVSADAQGWVEEEVTFTALSWSPGI